MCMEFFYMYLLFQLEGPPSLGKFLFLFYFNEDCCACKWQEGVSYIFMREFEKEVNIYEEIFFPIARIGFIE